MDILREPELNEDMKIKDIVERVYEISISTENEQTELNALMFLYNHYRLEEQKAEAEKSNKEYLQKYADMMTILKK